MKKAGVPNPIAFDVVDAPRGPDLLSFEVVGVPKGEPRMRSTRDGKLYRDKVADGWKHEVRAACKLALLLGCVRGLIPLGEPVMVEVNFWFPRPKSHFRTGRYAHLLRPGAPTYHVAKPDADNLSKAVLDAISKFDGCPPLVWCDDQQVAWITSTKRYADPGVEPGAHVLIYGLERGYIRG